MLRIITEKLREIKQNPKATLITAVTVGLYTVLAQLVTGTICVLNAVFGLPCPACGITRAFLAAGRLDFEAALRFHPLIGLFVLGGIIAVLKNKLPPRLFKTVMWVSLIMLFGVYIVRMLLYFPHTEPLSLNRESFLWRIIQLFN